MMHLYLLLYNVHFKTAAYELTERCIGATAVWLYVLKMENNDSSI